MDENHKPCPSCNKPMNRQSKICHICYRTGIIKPMNYIREVCPVCGTEFSVHISQKLRGQGIYCSRSCARSGSPTRKKTKPLVRCYECGKEFEKYKCEIVKNIGDLHFCSPACWYKHNTRENHYLWSGGQNERNNFESQAWRRKIWNRDKGRCRVCNATTEMEAHHIKPFGKYPEIRWDINNGILLCHECHSKTFQHESEYETLFTLLISVTKEI